MGLAKAALQFIAREHHERAFEGPVLTFGRQEIATSYAAAVKILQSEGLKLPGISSPKISSSLRIRDLEFFHLLGLDDVQALDYSDYEHAEILHDLNSPVPDALREKFGFILDGGTLEHVFDVRQGLANVAAMLKPGGRVLHHSPANNWTNHGFYQFSPTLYFDYYEANRFTNLRGFVAEQPLLSFEYAPWELYQVTSDAMRMTTGRGLMNFFIAEKGIDSTSDGVPMQSFYRDVYARDSKKVNMWYDALRKWVPPQTQARVAERVPWLNPFHKPRGLTRRARIG